MRKKTNQQPDSQPTNRADCSAVSEKHAEQKVLIIEHGADGKVFFYYESIETLKENERRRRKEKTCRTLEDLYDDCEVSPGSYLAVFLADQPTPDFCDVYRVTVEPVKPMEFEVRAESAEEARELAEQKWREEVAKPLVVATTKL